MTKAQFIENLRLIPVAYFKRFLNDLHDQEVLSGFKFI